MGEMDLLLRGLLWSFIVPPFIAMLINAWQCVVEVRKMPGKREMYVRAHSTCTLILFVQCIWRGLFFLNSSITWNQIVQDVLNVHMNIGLLMLFLVCLCTKGAVPDAENMSKRARQSHPCVQVVFAVFQLLLLVPISVSIIYGVAHVLIGVLFFLLPCMVRITNKDHRELEIQASSLRQKKICPRAGKFHPSHLRSQYRVCRAQCRMEFSRLRSAAFHNLPPHFFCHTRWLDVLLHSCCVL